jgi:hypothetical protein
MIIEINLIAGIMLGAEYVQNPEDGTNFIVVDILFVRILFEWA